MCKGFADERGNHFLMHAKVITGGICATGKNLDFSSSLMRKLRSSVAKYLLGESRGSRGVYSQKEMGGLSGCSSDIIRARGMHGAVLGLSSCCLSRAGSYHPRALHPASAHAALSLTGVTSPVGFFILMSASKIMCFSLCVCVYV